MAQQSDPNGMHGSKFGLEVDDGVSSSMAAFFTSLAASLVISQGWTMVSELKLCFTPFLVLLACSFRFLLAGFQHHVSICWQRPY
jgi:hypothetical protein